MSRSRRCSQARWRARQYHGRADRVLAQRPWSGLIPFLVLLLCSNASPAGAVSLLNIRVLEGEGAVHAAGGKASRGIVVQVTDETGKPLDGVAVSFRMPEEGPGATFERGMRTEIAITDPEGRAAVYNMHCGERTGPFQVRVTAAKNQVRAGTIVNQYISESTKSSKIKNGGSRKKWLIITAAAAAGVAGAIALGSGGGATTGSGGAPTPTIPPQIGTPDISVGRP